MSKRWLMGSMCGAMLLGAGYFLWTRGFQSALAYAPMLLCPLMHLLLMGGMHHAGKDRSCHGSQKQAAAPAPSGGNPAA